MPDSYPNTEVAQSTFAYRAREVGGEIITGTMAAQSLEEVGTRLRAEGKYVLSVSDKPMRETFELDVAQVRRNEAVKRIRREDVIAFCQQLSVMIDTGVPLAEALDSFCRQIKRREFREVIERVRDDIYSGESISSTLAKWPRVFPNIMISLMKASEASGTMAMMLGRIGDYLSKERRTARQIKGALSYPAFMLSAGIVLTIFLMIFILPRFATIYAQRSATLPVPTRILLGMSEFMTTQYLVYGPVVLGLLVAGYVWSRQPSGKRALDWLRLNVPVLRGMYAQLYLTRATRTMGTLLAAGVNLLDIIDICRDVTANAYYSDLWNRMERDVRDGKQLSDSVSDVHFIPSNVASMISSGERSGKLSDVMERIAVFAEEELDTSIKSVTAYIEPVAIICMGVIVGGVAMALLLPIFSMGKVVSGS